MAAEWYYLRDGQPHGPITRETLQQYLTSHSLDAVTCVWRSGMSEWLPATSLGFHAAPIEPPVAGAPPPIPPLPPSPPAPPLSTSALGFTTEAQRTQRRDVESSRRIWTLGVVAGLSVLIGIGVGWIARSLTVPADKSLQIALTTSDASQIPVVSGPPVTSAGDARPVDGPPIVPSLSTPVRQDQPPAVPPPAGTELHSPPPNSEGDPIPELPNPASSVPPAGSGQLRGSPSEKPDAKPADRLPPTPTPTEAGTSTSFFQELDIERTPRFSILGTAINQDLRYQILSELNVDTPDADGTRSVEQTVVDTKLVRADDLSRATFGDSLRELKGQRFNYKVNRLGAVTGMEAAAKGGRQAVPVRPPNAQGFVITSVMDPDGWREMAELTFLAPPHDAPSAPWTRGMRHDYGPLGSWYGDTQFRPGEARGGTRRIDFLHQLTYQPPGNEAGGLPFTIRDANLKPETADGFAQFDSQAGRITSAQERFVVRGQVNAELLGQVAPIELEESQTLKITVTDKNPWK